EVSENSSGFAGQEREVGKGLVVDHRLGGSAIRRASSQENHQCRSRDRPEAIRHAHSVDHVSLVAVVDGLSASYLRVYARVEGYRQPSAHRLSDAREPTDNHLGRALNKILKDLVVKSKTMAGFDAPYQAGHDRGKGVDALRKVRSDYAQHSN